MALESVAKTPNPYLLPYDEMNRAGELLAKARGIAAVVGAAAPHENELTDNAISNACWAIQDILDEVEKITVLKTEVQP